MNIFTVSLRLYCKKHRVSVRRLGATAGVSYVTVSRFLNGKAISSEDFTKILAWAMQDIPHDSPAKAPHDASHAATDGK